MPKDSYYETLGISRSATEDEIKSAYRKLAREHHPDVSKAPNAADRFAEISEAYDVLSDPEKRSRYDRFGRVDGFPGTPGGGRGGVGGWQEATNFEDLSSVFDSFFGNRTKASGRRPGQAQAKAKAQTQPTPATHEITVAFATMARGGQHPLTIERGGKRREIQVNIPAGIRSGAKLRVRGEGHALPGRPGKHSDLILTVQVEKHKALTRGKPELGQNEKDLFATVPVDIATATLGGQAEVEGITGSFELTVPPGSASGAQLRLRGQGIGPDGGPLGDLIATIAIVPPDLGQLTEEDRQQLLRIASIGKTTRTPDEPLG